MYLLYCCIGYCFCVKWLILLLCQVCQVEDEFVISAKTQAACLNGHLELQGSCLSLSLSSCINIYCSYFVKLKYSGLLCIYWIRRNFWCSQCRRSWRCSWKYQYNFPCLQNSNLYHGFFYTNLILINFWLEMETTF